MLFDWFSTMAMTQGCIPGIFSTISAKILTDTGMTICADSKSQGINVQSKSDTPATRSEASAIVHIVL